MFLSQHAMHEVTARVCHQLLRAIVYMRALAWIGPSPGRYGSIQVANTKISWPAAAQEHHESSATPVEDSGDLDFQCDPRSLGSLATI